MSDDAPKRKLPIGPIMLALFAGLTYGAYAYYQRAKPFEWNGTVEARTVSVGSRTGGRVKEVLVKEGDRVVTGQPLIRFEPADLEAQRLIAEAQLEQTKATLEKLEKGARPEELQQAKARTMSAIAALDESRAGARREQVQAAQARLASAQVSVDKAELDFKRIKQLADSGAASRAEYDNAEIALRQARAQRDASSQQLDELKNGSRSEVVRQVEARAKEAEAGLRLVESGTRREDLAAARAQVKAAQGRLDQIQVLLDELTVKALNPARVEALDLRPGDIVAPNAPVAVLLEEGQLYVRIYVPSTQLGFIRPGMAVPVTVDSFGDRAFAGVVEFVATVGEYTPRNLQTADERADQVFAARVGLREGLGELRAGMAAQIKVKRQ